MFILASEFYQYKLFFVISFFFFFSGNICNVIVKEISNRIVLTRDIRANIATALVKILSIIETEVPMIFQVSLLLTTVIFFFFFSVWSITVDRNISSLSSSRDHQAVFSFINNSSFYSVKLLLSNHCNLIRVVKSQQIVLFFIHKYTAMN